VLRENTSSEWYRVWLRYELFRGRLSEAEIQPSETDLVEFVKSRGNTKLHLSDLLRPIVRN
jgi:hypothetical protein